MKIILTCGHTFSGFEQAEQILLASGIEQAKPSKKEAFTPAQLQAKIVSAYKINILSGDPLVQLAPGKMWQELAVDQFMANKDAELWGWADPQTVYLLDFWREFDPQTRFVLVYSAPEYTVGQHLRNSLDPAADINAALASWLETNSQLLSFYNRYQDRCLLINSEALRANAICFTEKVTKHFALDPKAAIPKFDFPEQTDSAITAILARSLIEDCDAATSLYNELESSADLSVTSSIPTVHGKFHAWSDYIGLVTRFEQEAARNTEADIKEKELLKLQINQIQEELEHYLLRCQELTASQKQMEQQTIARSEEGKAATDKANADTEKLKSILNESNKENELLLLQLHQVQEELEHYFILYQELSQKSTRCETEEGRLLERLLIDLRSDFDGNNWYEAETEGRWAGPETTSSIRFPPLVPGEYLLELNINYAMSPEILNGMELRLNGSIVEFGITNQIPIILTSRFVQEQLNTASVNELQLKFPNVISPADNGSTDQRSLAVSFSYLSIKHVKYDTEKSLQIESLRNSLEIDFKNDFDGDNWYDAEKDGRWAGPNTTSSIEIPQLMPGAYCLELEIVDSMAPEIFKNIEIIFNGTSVNIEKDDGEHSLLSGLFKSKKRKKGIVRAKLNIGNSNSNVGQELKFKFPEVITPADHGSSDQRYLAVKCSNLTLKRYI